MNKPFEGFPKNVHVTPVPDPVLGFILQEITDICELKVTLRGFWLTHQKKGHVRPIHTDEFLKDNVLHVGLRDQGTPVEDCIIKGLDLSVERQTFITYSSFSSNDRYYLINTEAHRQAIENPTESNFPRLEHFSETIHPVEPILTQRSNIFSLYENNIGTITPILADQLRQAETDYPWIWIEEAFDIAVNQNARNWAYISAILRRWTDEGKDSGKSGRHSEKNNRASHLEEYRQIRGHFPWESKER